MGRSPSVRSVAATALLVAAAYYVGAKAGLLFRFPPATTSVIWPPNSILTAVLLIAAPRRWWIYLLAALPAHLAAQLPAGWPTPLVLGLFVTNCSEAVIAAVFVRRFSDAPALDTLRRAVVFILGAVFLAPFQARDSTRKASSSSALSSLSPVSTSNRSRPCALSRRTPRRMF